jgi:multiple sugar transport system substrate-binding protein
MAASAVSLPLLGGTLSSCGGDQGQGGTSTIRISSVADVYASGFRKFADEIRQELGLTMEFDNVPPQDAYQQDLLEFNSGRSSHDIVLFEPAWLADYSRHLEPLEDLAAQYDVDLGLGDDVMPIFNRLYTRWEGVLYSVPWDGDQHNLYYNTQAFESEDNKSAFRDQFGYELKPPETWDQYRDMAEFFNGRDWNGDGKKKYGVAEAWKRGGFSFWWWANKFAAYGGVWFDENLQPLINSPAGILALENTLAIRDYCPPGATNFDYPELEAALIQEQVPMVVQWSSTGKSAIDPEKSNIVGNVGTALLPGARQPDGSLHRRPGLPTGWSAGVPKYAENKEAAIRLIAFISTQERALDICLDPGTAVDPWRQSSLEATSAWREAYPDSTEFIDQYVGVLRETLELGIPDLQIPGSQEYVTAADREISGAIAGKKSAQEALDAAADAWNTISDRAGRENQTAAWNSQYSEMKKLGITYRPEIADAAQSG